MFHEDLFIQRIHVDLLMCIEVRGAACPDVLAGVVDHRIFLAICMYGVHDTETYLFLYWLLYFLLSISEPFDMFCTPDFNFSMFVVLPGFWSMHHRMAEGDAILDCRCPWCVTAIFLGDNQCTAESPRPQSVHCWSCLLIYCSRSFRYFSPCPFCRSNSYFI